MIPSACGLGLPATMVSASLCMPCPSTPYEFSLRGVSLGDRKVNLSLCELGSTSLTAWHGEL